MGRVWRGGLHIWRPVKRAAQYIKLRLLMEQHRGGRCFSRQERTISARSWRLVRVLAFALGYLRAGGNWKDWGY